jgi:nitrogen fixation negative regulator NifL
MNDDKRYLFVRFRSWFWLLAGAWTVCIAVSLLWNLRWQEAHHVEMARRAAQITFENDLLYRRWAAKQGGVYVRISPDTPPNPYLEVPERDVTTTSGLSLTLVNPAYMARQVNALAGTAGGSRGHLTSLKPIRPENGPDLWETAALRSFEQGVREVHSVETMSDGQYLRLMRPFVTEPGCLKCHAAQGYKEGDIRGGISVSVPMAPLQAIGKPLSTNLSLAHAGLWLVGLTGLAVFRRSLGREAAARERANLELRHSERRYRCFVDVTSQFAWATDPEGQVIEDIPALRQFTGQTYEQAKGAGWADALHPDDAPRTLEVWQRAVSNRTPYETEYRMRRYDGVYRLLLARGVPILDEQGNVTEWVGTCIDITERKQAEEALRRSEQRFRLLVEQTVDGIFVADTSGRFIDVNPAGCEMLGYSHEEVLERRIADMVVEEEIARIPAEVARFANGDVVTSEWQFRRKDGSVFFGEVVGRLLPDGRLQAILRDITERREAQRQLRLQASVLQAAANAIAIINRDGQIEWVNEAFARLTGYSLEEARGQNPRVLKSGQHPPEFYRRMWETVLSGKVWRDELINRRKDGSLYPEEMTITPVCNELGAITHFIAIKQDITERKRAEAALRESELFYRQTLESIPGMVFTTRPDGYCDYQSQQWVEFTGVPMREHLGDGWNKLLHPEDRPRAFAAWRAAVEGRATYDLEYRVRRHDGQYEWFKVIGRPIRDASGQIVRWFGVVANINELKSTEAQLRQAQEKLRVHAEDLEKIVASRTAKLHETIDELEHFSYAIVHDMRAPLRAMQGFATLIEDECAGCERTLNKEYFRRIKIAANRMDQLIADSLSYSKAVRQDLPLEPVELFQLLDGLVKTYPNLQPDQAEIQIDPDLPTVLGNEAALTQCFGNLLGNAVKFAKPGTKPQVCIRTEMLNTRLSTLNPMVRIWVEDHGIGIPKAAWERIFGLFQRATEKQEGTGIGLAIVRKVVERMGGKVGVESEPGQGSRFWVELPLA